MRVVAEAAGRDCGRVRLPCGALPGCCGDQPRRCLLRDLTVPVQCTQMPHLTSQAGISSTRAPTAPPVSRRAAGRCGRCNPKRLAGGQHPTTDASELPARALGYRQRLQLRSANMQPAGRSGAAQRTHIGLAGRSPDGKLQSISELMAPRPWFACGACPSARILQAANPRAFRSGQQCTVKKGGGSDHGTAALHYTQHLATRGPTAPLRNSPGTPTARLFEA